MNKIGVQMFSTVPDKVSLAERLRKVKACGADTVEFAGYDGMSPETLKKVLDDCGLTAVGSHVSLEQLTDHLDEEIAYAKTLGYRHLVCPYAPMQTAEDARALAGVLRPIAQRLAQLDLCLSYHNHAHEYGKDEGTLLLDHVLQACPELGFEMDIFWTAVGGMDPVAHMQRWNGRLTLVHVKELGAGDEHPNVVVGDGILDIPAVMREAQRQQVNDFIIEQEEYPFELYECIRRGVAYLRNQ